MPSLALALFCVCAAGVLAAPPTPPSPIPRWPAQWMADVSITGPLQYTPPKEDGATAEAATAKRCSALFRGENDATEYVNTLVPESARGRYYYDSINSRVGFDLIDALTGAASTSATLNNVVWSRTASTGVCTEQGAVSSNTTSRFGVLSPDWLQTIGGTGAQFVGNEYYQRGDVLFWTYHYHFDNAQSGDAFSAIDYYHCVVTDAPFRIVWTNGQSPLSDPVIMDIANGVNSGFGGFVPAPFNACPSADPATARSPAARRGARAEPCVKASTARGLRERAAPSPTGTPWPLAFTASVAYTGDIFGLELTEARANGERDADSADVVEPEVQGEDMNLFVQQTLFGTYYYDWANNRESSVWRDGGVSGTAAPTQTTIRNGSFYAIDWASGTCIIPPTAPVNGPLKPSWPTNLHYLDAQVIAVDTNASPVGAPGAATRTYVLTDHYQWDAFGAGPDHSFNYWQHMGLPVMFGGPVLDFYPYFQSYSTYTSVHLGLGGVDTEALFAVPTNCTVIPPGMLLHPEQWSSVDGAPLEVNLRLFSAVAASATPFHNSLRAKGF